MSFRRIDHCREGQMRGLVVIYLSKACNIIHILLKILNRKKSLLSENGVKILSLCLNRSEGKEVKLLFNSLRE